MKKSEIFNSIGLVAWIVAIGTGFTALSLYSAKPAQNGLNVAQAWPSQVHREPGQETLVVFMNPKCGCSRATLAEVERLLPPLQNKVHVMLEFYYPKKSDEKTADEYMHTRLTDLAATFPGVEIKFDKAGQDADLFGAKASGEAMYFSARGDLKFHGGLTPLRGHTGDSIGRDAVLALAEGQVPSQNESKVFGCQLKEELANEVALAQ